MCTRFIVGLCILLAPCFAVQRNLDGEEHWAGTVSTQEVEATLRSSLEAVIRGGNDAAARRHAVIESRMAATFQALPKNAMGRLAPQSVRYIVHNYFAKEHGWLIKGLEPHGMRANATEMHELNILQDKAPALVESLLEARQSDHGLSLGDVVVMAAALERLIFDESIALLEAAYELNGLSFGDRIDEARLHEVLTSYLLVFELGVKGNLSDARGHQMLKARAARAQGSSWRALVEYELDFARSYDYNNQHVTNPFVPHQYSFEASSQIVENMAHGYGKWQNAECRQMKEHLMDLAADGSGRVPLGTFYSQPKSAVYQFTESMEYLREVGAIDESGPKGPGVLIANYLTGPSNCIATSTYYSVCCLSECEAVMNVIEEKVQAPTVSPERLLALVGNLSSSSIDAPRQLSTTLTEKLHEIAGRHGGEVFLHGRLFAQWLHFAFPNECPYPRTFEDTAALTPSHWVARSPSATAGEMAAHIDASTSAPIPEGDSAPSLSQWSDDEVLPLQDKRSGGRGLGGVVKTTMQLAVLMVALRAALGAWQSGKLALNKANGMDWNKKHDVFV